MEQSDLKPFQIGDNIVRWCPDLYLHFFWGLLLMLVGFITILTRIIGRWKPKALRYHPWFGRFWFYGMIVQLYTSLYARNDGMRWFIFFFGIICYGCLIAGHGFIRLYKEKMLKHANANQKLLVREDIAASNDAERDTEASKPKTPIANKDAKPTIDVKWFKIPVIYFKYAHGVFMTISYVMLFGAGIMFTRRWMDVGGCREIYVPSGYGIFIAPTNSD
eukprot:TRINITY_DN7449_c0_g1_i1.p1 TRINITY_DN7449_c0_g1~~TRINITY_DN7449_c0_g1_i1.p1  ORF type:complete len:219 (+),score=22.36 TRINITY_DN7449_c0_g1_i1:50-706(+)